MYHDHFELTHNQYLTYLYNATVKALARLVAERTTTAAALSRPELLCENLFIGDAEGFDVEEEVDEICVSDEEFFDNFSVLASFDGIEEEIEDALSECKAASFYVRETPAYRGPLD